MSSKKWSHMFCNECKQEKGASDFIRSDVTCYKCVYKIKCKTWKKKKNYCQFCGQEIAHDDNLKKRQRNVYCSEDCALAGHKVISTNYWTRVLKRKMPLMSIFPRTQESSNRQNQMK